MARHAPPAILHHIITPTPPNHALAAESAPHHLTRAPPNHASAAAAAQPQSRGPGEQLQGVLQELDGVVHILKRKAADGELGSFVRLRGGCV